MRATEDREFEQAWRQVETAVLARCRRHRNLLQRVGEEDQDVAQEVRIAMLRVHRRHGIDNPVPLAARITECRLKDRMRRSRPELIELTEATEPKGVMLAPPAMEVELREADEEFAELRLLALDTVEDRALALREDRLGRTQIAKQMRIPEPAVSSTLQRARRRINAARVQRETRGLCAMLAPVLELLAAGAPLADGRQRAAARRHLSHCPRCRLELATARRRTLTARQPRESGAPRVRLNGHEGSTQRAA